MSREIICITGGIGSGKSVVSRILRLQGFEVYDCDSRAKTLMAESSEIRDVLLRLVGEEVFLTDGSIHRQLLADRLFSDAQLRLNINSTVHRAVKADIFAAQKCLAARGVNAGAPNKTAPLFVESAIPSTARLDEICSAFWIVEAPQEIRIKRVMERSALSHAQIKARIDTQLSEYASLPPRLSCRIINDGAYPLLPQIQCLINDL